jgi:hypothetical protein
LCSRIVRTGHGAVRTMLSAMLPISARRTPRRPCVHHDQIGADHVEQVELRAEHAGERDRVVERLLGALAEERREDAPIVRRRPGRDDRSTWSRVNTAAVTR